MCAPYHNIDNLVVIIDRNGVQNDWFVKDTMELEPLDDKLRAFGWHAIKCDGHDFARAAGDAFDEAKRTKGQAHGDHREDREGQGRQLHGEQSGLARQRAHRRSSSNRRWRRSASDGERRGARRDPRSPRPSTDRAREGGRANRRGRCRSRQIDNLARVSEGVSRIASSPSASRKQNMIGVSAGLAAAGKTAFCSTFGVFMPGRCFDQIRVSVAQTGLNVKMVASHGGISVGEDGVSAHGDRGPGADVLARRRERPRAGGRRRSAAGDRARGAHAMGRSTSAPAGRRYR